jgi:nucleoside-diphosphate-sugar epimerase
MKRALITGAEGFIGSHLADLLLQNGYLVRALSFYNSFNYWGWLENINANSDLTD